MTPLIYEAELYAGRGSAIREYKMAWLLSLVSLSCQVNNIYNYSHTASYLTQSIRVHTKSHTYHATQEEIDHEDEA